MQNHNIERLQKNLHRLTKQVDAIANFRKHHDSLRSVFASEFQPHSSLLNQLHELECGENVVTTFYRNAQAFLEMKWLPLTESERTFDVLSEIEDLRISVKGMSEPAQVSWGILHHDATMVFDFGAGQMKVKATITQDSEGVLTPQIDVSYVEFNHQSVIEIAVELGIETAQNQNVIEGNKLVAAAFKMAEQMFNQYLLLLDYIDCSNQEEIRMNLYYLDEIEVKDAIDSTSMDVLSATQPRQVQSVESRLMAEVDNMIETVTGSSITVSRDEVCDAIEKITH